MTRPIVGTNLKMHLTSTQLADYLRVLRTAASSITACDLFVLPSYPCLWVARQELAGTDIGWGAQDVHPAEGGAHTGDVSAAMLVDLGCRYVQVGHAERRRDHRETDALVGAKLRQALRHGLTPVLCVGEPTLRPLASAVRTVRRQLGIALDGAGPLGEPDLVVAYEPAWAIGAGATAARPDHVAAMHAAIHARLAECGASGVRVMYGGSNDEIVAGDLVALPGVDGLFVGRAALDPARLAAIAAIVQRGARPVGRS